MSTRIYIDISAGAGDHSCFFAFDHVLITTFPYTWLLTFFAIKLYHYDGKLNA